MRTSTKFTAVAVSAIGLALAAVSPAQAATYSTGHFDLLDVDRSATGTVTLDVKAYSPANDDLSPAGNTFAVGSNTLGTVGSGLACLGATSDPVYRLPQSQPSNNDRLYAGWNTEDAGATTTLSLVSASMPAGARFAVYQSSSFGSASFKLNTNTTSGCQVGSFGVSAGSHAHGFWAFTKPGTYTLVFKATVGTASSSNVTYSFKVG